MKPDGLEFKYGLWEEGTRIHWFEDE